MADAPAPPPPPSAGPPAASTISPRPQGQALGLTRDIRRSVRLKSWSAKSTDGSEKRGWLHKKLPGKSKFISCWFELDEPNELVSLYTDNPNLGPIRSNFIEAIDLTEAKFRCEEKKGQLFIYIKEEGSKKHTMIAANVEEQEAWSEAFKRSRAFNDKARSMVTQWGTSEEISTKLGLNPQSAAPASAPKVPPIGGSNKEVFRQIEDPAGFWSTLVQDPNNRQVTMEEVVGKRTCVCFVLYHYGALLSRHLVGKVLALAKDELNELGLHPVILGSGSHALIKQNFLKDLTAKEKLTTGFTIYSDHKGVISQAFRERFELRADRNASAKQQMFGIYVLNYRQGLIYSFLSQHHGHFPDFSELSSSVKSFNRFFDEHNWSPIKLPKMLWSEMVSPADDKTRTVLVDRASGYEYELGTNNPPLGNYPRLMYNFYAFRDFFYEKNLDVFAVDDNGEDGEGPLVLVIDASLGPYARNSIIYSKAGPRKALIPVEVSESPKETLKYVSTKLLGKPVTREVKWTQIDDPAVKEALLSFEAKTNFTQYKFGVLYAKNGRIGEDEMYSNMEQSKDFEEFLEFLGTKVTLNGWDKFRGGLDHRGSDLTGTHSYFTQYQGNEIMYHVATMMPWNENDPSRKRHLGNDVVLIIFKDSNNTDRFDPHVIRSQFNHIFLIVEKVQGPKGPSYQFEFAYKPGLPPFPPFLSHPPIMPINKDTREFLLTKLVNSERQTIKFAKIFQVNMATTAEALLNDLIKTFTDPKRPKPNKAAPAAVPAVALRAAVPKESEFNSGLNFDKLTEGLAVAAAAAPPGVESKSPESTPSSSDSPSPALAAAPDPYERLEMVVLKALVKEEGLVFSNSAQAYHDLSNIYFGAGML